MLLQGDKEGLVLNRKPTLLNFDIEITVLCTQ